LAYDEALADRVRDLLSLRADVGERKMFGGIAFMLAGNMCCGVIREDLIVRTFPEDGEAALEEPDVRPFDLTGRTMTGFLLVGPGATASEEDLRSWIDRAVTVAETLPPK
jgi:TfoX/Sxy family transcriptional regulator of competence genes